ncbi:hypothetical protein DFH07DRAFT_797206 [Mycena maculata]|uniref:Uncharacterized protein n=1 Tax=Mycena maculata TaxID=230809 RepID=A0AAD7K5I5_9AGAR|nr:hypothetical protein DFH07DRAFT_797206 [Mycena maculata]
MIVQPFLLHSAPTCTGFVSILVYSLLDFFVRAQERHGRTFVDKMSCHRLHTLWVGVIEDRLSQVGNKLAFFARGVQQAAVRGDNLLKRLSTKDYLRRWSISNFSLLRIFPHNTRTFIVVIVSIFLRALDLTGDHRRIRRRQPLTSCMHLADPSAAVFAIQSLYEQSYCCISTQRNQEGDSVRTSKALCLPEP